MFGIAIFRRRHAGLLLEAFGEILRVVEPYVVGYLRERLPALGHKLLGTLHKGNSLPYLGQTASDERGVTWYKVSYNGSAGWVSSKYTKVR